jgi:hypothetical protein
MKRWQTSKEQKFHRSAPLTASPLHDMHTKKRMATKINAPKKEFGAFNQGTIPTVACFNRAETPLGIDFDTLIKAMQVYVDKHVVPVWDTHAKLTKSDNFVKGAWAMAFLDDTDQADFLGYHDLTPDGLPLSKVFVRTILRDKASVSVVASHELVEMLVDPAINLMTTGPDLQTSYAHESADRSVILYESADEQTFYAYESADPVEDETFKVNGVDMSDFVYPAYFEKFHKPRSVKFDHLDLLERPFQILPGGYQTIFRNGRWSNLFASTQKQRRFAKEDRRGHRSEMRKLGTLIRSE